MKHIVFLLFTIINLYAIVSVAPVDVGEKPGLTGIVNGSLETKRGNTDSDNYSTGLRVSYDNNISYVMWGEASFSYGEAQGSKNANKTYEHLRYIERLKKNIDWEAFLQLQSNEFTNVDKRFLSGLGLRIYAKDTLYGNFYLGIGSFYEYITYITNFDKNENNIRANIYLAYKKVVVKGTELSLTSYCQPKFEDVNDYIWSNSVELKVLIYEKLYIKFNLSYAQDSQPAIGVKQEDFAQKTSFIYNF